MTSFLPFVVQCLEKTRKEQKNNNKLVLRIYVKILSYNFSVENDPMKGVESFTVLYFYDIKIK